jgi:hypothetical protein
VSQTFTARRDALAGLAVALAPGSNPQGCAVSLELRDASGAEVAATAAPCAEPSGAPALLAFPARSDSGGRRYSITVSSTGTATGGANALVDAGDVGGEQLAVNGTARGGHLAIQPFATPVAGLLRTTATGPVSVFRVPDASRFDAIAEQARRPETRSALNVVAAPDFDSGDAVVVGARRPTVVTGGKRSVTVLDDQPTQVRVRVGEGGAGWLLARQTWFPGWVARVDGHRRPFVRVDVAFGGVRLPARATTVALSYEPRTVRVGALVSLLAALALAGAAVAVAAGWPRLAPSASTRRSSRSR